MSTIAVCCSWSGDVVVMVKLSIFTICLSLSQQMIDELQVAGEGLEI